MTQDEIMERAYAPGRVTATCAWGFASDVMLHDSFADRDGKEVYLDLTSEQARNLAADLMRAAEQAENYDADYINEQKTLDFPC